MINMYEVSETNKMIESENLDVRTITLGISLLDCVDSDWDELNRRFMRRLQQLQKILYLQEKTLRKNSEFRS